MSQGQKQYHSVGHQHAMLKRFENLFVVPALFKDFTVGAAELGRIG